MMCDCCGAGFANIFAYDCYFPMPDCKISFNGQEIDTDENGRAQFKKPSQPGNYTVVWTPTLEGWIVTTFTWVINIFQINSKDDIGFALPIGDAPAIDPDYACLSLSECGSPWTKALTVEDGTLGGSCQMVYTPSGGNANYGTWSGTVIQSAPSGVQVPSPFGSFCLPATLGQMHDVAFAFTFTAAIGIFGTPNQKYGSIGICWSSCVCTGFGNSGGPEATQSQSVQGCISCIGATGTIDNIICGDGDTIFVPDVRPTSPYGGNGTTITFRNTGSMMMQASPVEAVKPVIRKQSKKLVQGCGCGGNKDAIRNALNK